MEAIGAKITIDALRKDFVRFFVVILPVYEATIASFTLEKEFSLSGCWWTGGISVTLNCHKACSQFSLTLQLDYAIQRQTFSHRSFLYSCTLCFYCGVAQRC